MIRLAGFLLCTLAVFAAAPKPAAATTRKPGPLTASEMKQLKRLPFRAAVPDKDDLPDGFVLIRVTFLRSQGYQLIYRHPNGAILVFEGLAAPAGSSRQANVEQSLAQLERTASSKSYNQPGTLGEDEARVTALQAPNDDVGPASFAPHGACYVGVGDPKQASIPNAVFLAAGCYLGDRIDLLTRGYQSLAPVP